MVAEINGGGRYRYPRQGDFLGRTVEVCFDYDVTRSYRGKVIREDIEGPGLMLVQLEDGRVVRSVECQYRLLDNRRGERE
jgi:hypothetical protein